MAAGAHLLENYLDFPSLWQISLLLFTFRLMTSFLLLLSQNSTFPKGYPDRKIPEEDSGPQRSKHCDNNDDKDVRPNANNDNSDTQTEINSFN